MSIAEAALITTISEHFGPTRPARIAVAVSGGSDSMALLCLMRAWSDAGGPQIAALTVDHGLRPEAAAEAEQVARLCEAMNVPHRTLRWDGWNGQGNLADQARRARYRLMGDWAQSQGICDIALGHTADDQAETLLLRLARQAGLDGMSGMAAKVQRDGVTLHRPLLGATRSELRAFLTARGQGWIDDISNEDSTSRRVRARVALPALAPLGITPLGLSNVARHLAEARETLAGFASDALDKVARIEAGDVVFARAGWEGLRADLRRRLMQAALRWVSGAEYPARGAAVEGALTARADTVLHGCRVLHSSLNLRITREAAALADVTASPCAVWDGRWRVTGPFAPGDRIGALTEAALPHCPDRKASGLPAASLISSPAIWRDGALVAAPLAGLGDGWSAELLRSREDLRRLLFAH